MRQIKMKRMRDLDLDDKSQAKVVKQDPIHKLIEHIKDTRSKFEHGSFDDKKNESKLSDTRQKSTIGGKLFDESDAGILWNGTYSSTRNFNEILMFVEHAGMYGGHMKNESGKCTVCDLIEKIRPENQLWSFKIYQLLLTLEHYGNVITGVCAKHRGLDLDKIATEAVGMSGFDYTLFGNAPALVGLVTSTINTSVANALSKAICDRIIYLRELAIKHAIRENEPAPISLSMPGLEHTLSYCAALIAEIMQSKMSIINIVKTYDMTNKIIEFGELMGLKLTFTTQQIMMHWADQGIFAEANFLKSSSGRVKPFNSDTADDRTKLALVATYNGRLVGYVAFDTSVKWVLVPNAETPGAYEHDRFFKKTTTTDKLINNAGSMIELAYIETSITGRSLAPIMILCAMIHIKESKLADSVYLLNVAHAKRKNVYKNVGFESYKNMDIGHEYFFNLEKNLTEDFIVEKLSIFDNGFKLCLNELDVDMSMAAQIGAANVILDTYGWIKMITI